MIPGAGCSGTAPVCSTEAAHGQNMDKIFKRAGRGRTSAGACAPWTDLAYLRLVAEWLRVLPSRVKVGASGTFRASS